MEFNIFKIVLINVWVFELRIKDVESREKMKIKKTQSLQWSWFWSIRNDQICVHYSKRGA